MAEKGSINENELDGLLRDLYLEENSHTVNEIEANFILAQNYDTTINTKKEKELLNKLQNKPDGFSSMKLLFSLLGISILIALLLYFYLDTNHSTIGGSIQTNQNIDTEETHVLNSEKEKIAPDNNTLSLKIRDTFGRPEILNSTISLDSSIDKNNFTQYSENIEQSVPYLTEKDKLKYKNIKEQILKALVKSDKGLYTKIPAFETDYAGKSIVLDAFTIRNVGITNLEYKTFLADLLAQNKNEDYLTCKVLNENWKEQGFTNLANAYFQNEKYNDFPVVNISYEAAKLFCKWLEDEIKIYTKQNGLKANALKIRLPYDEEWIFAAREGYAKIAFEKGYNTIYDETSRLVSKSFTNRVELVKKRVKRLDTLYSIFTTNRYGWSEKQTLNFFELGFNYYKTVTNDTIYIDRMKVLGKIGHVSEMVPQKNTDRIWLSGLSWKNKEDYQKLEQDFNTNTCSPFVGFRIVVVNPNDPEYKKPFW